MSNICVVNKKTVSQNKKMRQAQKNSRRYYQEKIFHRANNAPKAKIRKIANMQEIRFKKFNLSDDISENKCEYEVSKEQLIDLCKRIELTGRSGNGFLTYKKLKAFQSENGILVINGVECDPGLVHDAWIYRNKMTDVSKGIEIIKNAFGIRRVILATKEPINSKLRLEQVKVVDRFPMGYERSLIKYITGKEIPADKNPAECGILVLNLQTVLAIAEILEDEKRAIEKYITVADISEANAFVTKVKLGDTIEDITKTIFTTSDRKGKKIYVGSGALDCHLIEAGEKVTERINYIAIGNAPDYEKAAKCKGCNACTRNCPMGVDAQKLVRLAEKDNLTKDMVDTYKAYSCIGCGACTYGCVAEKDIREVIRWAKENI